MKKECLKKYKVVNLTSMRCVNKTIDKRINNDSIISRDLNVQKSIKTLNSLGEGKHGKVFKSCYPKENCRYLLIEKVSTIKPLPDEDREIANKDIDKLLKLSEKYNSLREIAVMYLSDFLVSRKFTQNLPLLYTYKIFKDKTLFASELADQDFKSWLLSKKRKKEELDNAMFQIFHGIYSLCVKFNISHNDLHWSNVLVHKVKPGGLWVYEINNKKLYLPNIGYVFVIWDFDFANSQNQDGNIFTDLSRISYCLNWANDEKQKNFYKNTNRYLDKVKAYYSNYKGDESIISYMFPQYKKRPSGYKTISKFKLNN